MNENTIGILKLISGITNSVIIEHPVTSFVDEYGNVLGAVHLDKGDDFKELKGFDFQNGVGIYDLKLFLNKLQMFQDPVIELKDKQFIIKNDTSSITHNTSDIDVLQNYKGNYKIIQSTLTSKSADTVSEFRLDKDTIDSIIKAHGNLPGSDTVYVIGEDKGVNIAVGTDNTFNKNTEIYKTSVFGESKQDFEIKIPINSIKAIPKIDYNVIIKYNKEKNAYRVYLTDDSGIFEFVLSTIS